MINKTEIKDFFTALRTKRRFASILFSVSAISLGVFLLPTAARAQRLCENNDNPVATIEPCFGTPGTVIKVKRGRVSPASGKLVFKRIIANGIPAQALVEVSADSTSEAPPQLCTVGGGRWEVWLILADGKSQGKIGAFTVSDCSNGKAGVKPKPIPKPQPNPKPIPKPQPNPKPDQDPNPDDAKTVILEPITMNVDNEVYAKTRNSSQSYIKRISSSVPTVATGTEWGTNEVKIRGKRPGVTMITFFDDNANTIYKVKVTVKERRKAPKDNDGGAIRTPPQKPAFDPCLVGEWLAVKVNGTVEGGTGIRLTIKPDGTQIADYTAMQILNLNGLTYRYGGTAEGVLSAADGFSLNTKINREEVTLSTGAYGEENAPKPAAGMGPGALGINLTSNGYSCDDKFLNFSVEDYQGKKFLDITMERQSAINNSKAVNQPKPTPKPIVQPKPQPKPAPNNSKMDPCLVGTWRSDFMKSWQWTVGGLGIILTVNANGQATIDYNGSLKLELEYNREVTHSSEWRGTAAGILSTSGNMLNLMMTKPPSLFETHTAYGNSAGAQPRGGFGVAFNGNANNLSYVCSEMYIKLSVIEPDGTEYQAFGFRREK